MSLNLLDLVKTQVTDSLVKQATNYLGESESSIGKALGGIMPTLLGSAVEKATNPIGSQGLLDMISGLDLDSLGDIAGLFGGGDDRVSGLLNSGGGLVDSLLGSKSSGVIDMISKFAGLKNDSTSTLFKMAAPLLMGVIGRQVKGKGLSALTDLLMGQKSNITGALPAGMGSLLNLTSLNDLTKNIQTPNVNVSGGGVNWMKWLIPLVLAAVALYYFSTKGCGNKVVESTTDVMEHAGDMAKEAMDTTLANVKEVSNFFTKKLATGFELVNAAPEGIESQLITFVEDNSKVVDKTTWFNFDRLLFDTGSANLQASSKEQLVNIAEILKAYPNVKIKIGGYTDNAGNPKSNLKLSTDRAYNVMNELVGLGIDKTRLAAEGYGQEFPIGDNNTEEGRQQNRRISVRVTAK
jgi:OOP family OmpA-OmpF porin